MGAHKRRISQMTEEQIVKSLLAKEKKIADSYRLIKASAHQTGLADRSVHTICTPG